MSEAEKAYWECQECGYTDKNKPMPANRDAFYRRLGEKGSPVCPRCKSKSFLPMGY